MKSGRPPRRGYLPLLDQLDAWQHRARLAHPGVIPCREGCHACCKGSFDISVADAELVIEAVAALPADVAGEVVAAAAQQVATMSELEPNWILPFAISTIGDDRFDAVADALAELPCPLLDPHGACRVYEHRPMVCRLMGLGLEAEDGYLVENDCPIQHQHPEYANLAPVPFRLIAWEEHEERAKEKAAQRLFGDRSFADFETTIAGAIAVGEERRAGRAKST